MYRIVGKGGHVHMQEAGTLHQLGFVHIGLANRYQERDFRLSDLHGHVAEEIPAQDQR